MHERLRSYTYLYPAEGEGDDFYHDADRSAARAAEYVEARIHRTQIRSHRRLFRVRSRGNPRRKQLERTVRWCARCAKRSGGNADLLLGTHGQFTTSGAVRLAKQLEPYDPLWFEEPVPPEMPEQMAKVARATSIPIATGERLTTKYEFARVLAAGAANILQMNLGRVGGLLEAKKVAALAEVHYAQIAPHLYCGPVVGAANIQIATCSPNFLILESIQQWGGFHAQTPEKADSLGGRLCHSADGARARRRARRGGGSGACLCRGKVCTWRWRAVRWGESTSWDESTLGKSDPLGQE